MPIANFVNLQFNVCMNWGANRIVIKFLAKLKYLTSKSRKPGCGEKITLKHDVFYNKTDCYR